MQVWDNYKTTADIWAFGCIMAFHCNRGEHLFQVTQQDLAMDMAQKMRCLPSETIRGYSSGLVDIIGRMLDPDSHRRPTAKDIWAECTDDRQYSDDESDEYGM